MRYPMNITRISARHRQGTKDYHLVLIEPADKGAMVINRWGKAKAWGQMKVETFDAYTDGKAAFQGKRDQKMGDEYTTELKNDTVIVNSTAELMGQLGAYLPKMGAANVEWLDKVIDTKGLPSAPVNPNWQQKADGTFADVQTPRLIPDPVPTVQEELAKDPDWGSF